MAFPCCQVYLGYQGYPGFKSGWRLWSYPFCHPSFHSSMPSYWFSMNLAVVKHAGFPDLCLKFWSDVSVTNGRGMCLVNILTTLCTQLFLCRLCDGKTLQRTGSRSVGIDLTVPGIMRIVWLSWTSISLQCELFIQQERHTLR